MAVLIGFDFVVANSVARYCAIGRIYPTTVGVLTCACSRVAFDGIARHSAARRIYPTTVGRAEHPSTPSRIAADNVVCHSAVVRIYPAAKDVVAYGCIAADSVTHHSAVVRINPTTVGIGVRSVREVIDIITADDVVANDDGGGG